MIFRMHSYFLPYLSQCDQNVILVADISTWNRTVQPINWTICYFVFYGTFYFT